MRRHRTLRLVAGLCCIALALAVDLLPVGGAPVAAQGGQQAQTIDGLPVTTYPDGTARLGGGPSMPLDTSNLVESAPLTAGSGYYCQASGPGDYRPASAGRPAGDAGWKFMGGLAGAVAGALAAIFLTASTPAWLPLAVGVGLVGGGLVGFGMAHGCGPSQPCPACNLQSPHDIIYAPDLYLYPGKTEAVRVALGGAVTASRPAYGPSGWAVRATPDGELLGGPSPVGHLFYEADAQEPWQAASGWVVPATGWPAWIETELPRLGLNATETADFRHDWATDLPAAPYYLVAPQPPALVNAAVPLEITPQPDTLYRLWLYIVPMRGPAAVQPPQPAPLVRRGFTAVEWGVVFPPGVVPPCAPEVSCPA